MLSTFDSMWLGAVGIFISGCATMSLDAGFTDVSRVVEERGGGKVVWQGGSELDKEAGEKVGSLLSRELTVDSAVQVALLNNRELQALYSDLGVAQADLVQAGLLNNPIFDAAIKFPTGGGRTNLELSTIWNFLEIFYLPLRKRVAAAKFEEVKLRVSGAVLDFAAQVRSAFFIHQANEQLLELRQTILKALNASWDIARRLNEAGNITDLDLARNRALTEAGKLALRSAEIAVRQSREQLNDLMGLWGKATNWQTDGRLADVPAREIETGELENVALRKSLDLLHSRQRVVVAGEQLGFDKNTALLPELHAGPLGEREEDGWRVGPTLEFPIPIFDQGQARVGRAVAELRRIQQEYYALAVRIRSMTRAVRDRLEGSRDRALYYRDILLPLHQRIVEESQLHYNAMQLGPVQLLRAREQQIETTVGYVEALRDYWLAEADLGQILNGRLPKSTGFQTIQSGGQMKIAERDGH